MSEPKCDRAERRDPAERPRPTLPHWLWLLLLTAAIVALLVLVGRRSFAA